MSSIFLSLHCNLLLLVLVFFPLLLLPLFFFPSRRCPLFSSYSIPSSFSCSYFFFVPHFLFFLIYYVCGIMRLLFYRTSSFPFSFVPCLLPLLVLHEITWYFMSAELTVQNRSFVMSQHHLPIYSPIYRPPYLPSYMPTCDAIYPTRYRSTSPFVSFENATPAPFRPSGQAGYHMYSEFKVFGYLVWLPYSRPD